MKKAILFDLDATLLPMNQDLFLKAYFGGLVSVLVNEGFDKNVSFNAIMKGTAAMIKNDGTRTNETAFWQVFTKEIGYDFSDKMDIFTKYYDKDFIKAKDVCGFNPESKKIIDSVKALGLCPILATNPVCPPEATYKRIEWAGLKVSDFELVTTYQNSSYSKPNPLYYKEILEKLSLLPEECVMVGNDTEDDLAASKIGIDVFILTDCLINKNNIDISNVPSGSFPELADFLQKIKER